ncbi:MAG: hypothetical protein LBI56_01105 [Puniceicoccales bacterium]|jgi:hypothetical protein|nr:hypothetical protein [Puniceicoccales bacterium]
MSSVISKKNEYLLEFDYLKYLDKNELKDAAKSNPINSVSAENYESEVLPKSKVSPPQIVLAARTSEVSTIGQENDDQTKIGEASNEGASEAEEVSAESESESEISSTQETVVVEDE